MGVEPGNQLQTMATENASIHPFIAAVSDNGLPNDLPGSITRLLVAPHFCFSSQKLDFTEGCITGIDNKLFSIIKKMRNVLFPD